MKNLINILIIALMLTVFAVAQDEQPAPGEQTAPLDTSKYSAERQDLVLGYNQLNAEKNARVKKMEHILYTIEYLNNFEAKLKADAAAAAAKDSAATKEPEKKKGK